ncbi:MAG: outer membrane beta-barrel protein [Verrucomicrobiota bacterium]
MKKLLTTLALACIASGAFANEVYFDTISTKKASRVHGSYIGVFGGGAHSQTANFRESLSGAKLQDDDGWLAGIEFGYEFEILPVLTAFTEAEFTFMSTPLDGVASGIEYRSDFRSVNAIFNFGVQLDLDDERHDVGDFWSNFKPFAGVGVGGAWTRSSNRKGFVDDRPVIGGDNDNDLAWAYQVFAGVEYAFSDYVSIYGEWRRMIIGDIGDGLIDDPEFDLWAIGMKFKY